jgi:hypothetical protein
MVDRLTVLAGLKMLIADALPDQLPALIGEIEGVKAQAWVRLAIPVRPAAEPERLVDATELARIIGVPVFWIQDKGRRGIIPRVTIGHYQRFNVPEVLEAVRHLPKSHDFQLRLTKKRPEKRGGARPVSIECPKPSAETAA